MPNWEVDGINYFGKLACKRCLTWFDSEAGEVPEHECWDGEFYKSESGGGEHHYPVKVYIPTIFYTLKDSWY